jgi:3-oxoacyl-[acyl-carrier-protein] synthase III
VSAEYGANGRSKRSHALTIASTGFAYPSLVVDNESFLERAEFRLEDPIALARETRMKSRTWCGPGETAWTLARAAARSAVAKAGPLRDEIDVIVVASATTIPVLHPGDLESPGMCDLAPLLARDLGREAFGFDVKACYCTGFLRCLEIADALLDNPNHRAALVVAAEQGSRLATAPTNRSAFCFIMSDAAGAAVLRKAPRSDRPFGLIDYVNGLQADKLDWVGVGADGRSMVMRGSRAGEATLSLLERAGKTLLARNALAPDQIDWLLPIQTHARLVDAAGASLGFPRDKVLWTGDVTGFSGSASIPACLAEQVATGKVKAGERVLAVAVGAGMSWGAALFEAG